MSKEKLYMNKSVLKKLYDQGMSQLDIAMELDCSQATVWTWMHYFGIPARHTGAKPKKRVRYKGEMLTISEASARSGIHANCLRDRIQRGVTEDHLFDESLRGKSLHIQGEDMTLSEAAERSGLHPSTIASRKRKGWSEDDLLKPKLKMGRRKKCR